MVFMHFCISLSQLLLLFPFLPLDVVYVSSLTLQAEKSYLIRKRLRIEHRCFPDEEDEKIQVKTKAVRTKDDNLLKTLEQKPFGDGRSKAFKEKIEQNPTAYARTRPTARESIISHDWLELKKENGFRATN
ncbi:hypothetical protein M9H77_18306 [Catharanthus roseus]|uniref:Uncharacterized protein n=1 Tax=Catharanthus roseus TaxID=4058 RepID=A0ACC0B7E4_CATRO|nr:hypothetical protein M9H77_18306 [Catharanthus roseus]